MVHDDHDGATAPTDTRAAFLKAVFGDTTGHIAFAVGADGDVRIGEPADVPVGGPDELVQVSPVTRDGAIDAPLHQSAIVTTIKDGHAPPILPSMVVEQPNEADRVGVWLIDQPVASDVLREAAAALGGSSECDPDETCPVPGTGGWRLAAGATMNVYSLAQVVAIPLLLNPITVAISPTGKKTRPGKWKDHPYTIGGMIGKLIHHKVGPKDGPSYLQGNAFNGFRLATAVHKLPIIEIDLDTGEQIEKIIERIEANGWLAAWHSTHSHMSEVSTPKKDAVMRHTKVTDRLPTLAECVSYLQDVKKVQPWVLARAAFEGEGIKETEEGTVMLIRHHPLPKYRLIFFLAKAFEPAKRGGSDQAGRIEWAERYAGLSEVLEAYYDQSCTDVSRLFFLPRHDEGKPFDAGVVWGKLLDLEKMPRISKRGRGEIDPSDHYAVAAKDMGAGANANDGKDRRGKLFFAKYGWRFLCDQFFLDCDPDGDRGPRSSGRGRTHACPFENEHTPTDGTDTGFYCVDAGDETEQSIAHCMHGCKAKYDRIDYVGAVLERVGKTWADLGEWVLARISHTE